MVRVPAQGAFGYQVPPPGVAAAATTTAPTTTASTVVQEFDAYRDMFESDLNAAENRALHMNIFGPTGKGKTVGAVNFLNKLQPFRRWTLIIVISPSGKAPQNLALWKRLTDEVYILDPADIPNINEMVIGSGKAECDNRGGGPGDLRRHGDAYFVGIS